MHDTLVATILNLVSETLSDFIDNVLQDETALVEPFFEAETSIIRQAIIRLEEREIRASAASIQSCLASRRRRRFRQSALSYISQRQRDSALRAQ